MIDQVWAFGLRPARSSPEVRLWSSVLYRAVVDLDDANERPYALAWLRSERDAIGSFRFCCDLLGLDHEWVRRMIRQRVQVDGRRMPVNRCAGYLTSRAIGEYRESA